MSDFEITPSIPEANVNELPLDGLNIVAGPNGSTMTTGVFQSPNFNAGVSGWKIDSAGNVEFGSGKFRGDITGASGTFSGTITGGSLNIPDTTTADSFHVDTAGNMWLGSTTLAGAVASITKAGVGTFSNIVITGGSVTGATIASVSVSTDISLLEKTHNLTFSVTDLDTVAWTSGTISFSNSRTFTISAGNTGNMAALTYIYLDTGVSLTVLQTTTTYSTSIGANKSLIGVANAGATTASFIPYGSGMALINGDLIGALTLTAGNIAASTITAAKMSVSDLSAISANIGTITAGTLTLDSSGYVRGGQTAYNTGTGFFLGYSGGAYKLSIGDSTVGNSLTWDGTTLAVNGATLAFQSEYGDGSDGNVTISVDTTITRDMYYNNLTINDTFTLITGGYRVFVKGTLTQVGSGKIARIGNAGGNGGNGSGITKGSAGAASAALGNGTVFGSNAGPAGGAGSDGGQSSPTTPGTGGAGSAITAGLGAVGAAGLANGGTGGSGTQSGGASSGAGGAAGAFTAVLSVPRTSYLLMIGHQMSGTALSYLQANGTNGGSGGGGGGGGHNAVGGSGGGGGGSAGSGSDGGMVFVAAKAIALSGSATLISVKGGAGGTGGNGGDASAGGGGNCGGGGGGGGGSAGNGGVGVLIYSTLSSGTIVFDVTAGAAGSGGTGGAKTNTGTIGNNGGTGRTGLSGTSVTLIV